MASPAPKRPPAKPFTMVRRSIWDSRRFTALPDDLCRYLYFYCLSCSHQTGTGCFVAREAYILSDLAKPGADWTAATYRARLQHLIASGLILVDAETNEILIVGWWKDNGPSNESWFAGAKKQCEGIESQTLREAAQGALADCWEAFLSAKGLPQRQGASLSGNAISASERVATLLARSGVVTQ
jgi:hypothetical protein